MENSLLNLHAVYRARVVEMSRKLRCKSSNLLNASFNNFLLVTSVLLTANQINRRNYFPFYQMACAMGKTKNVTKNFIKWNKFEKDILSFYYTKEKTEKFLHFFSKQRSK